eukprot:2349856-Rhodomonas_salina.5
MHTSEVSWSRDTAARTWDQRQEREGSAAQGRERRAVREVELRKRQGEWGRTEGEKERRREGVQRRERTREGSARERARGSEGRREPLRAVKSPRLHLTLHRVLPAHALDASCAREPAPPTFTS